MNQTIPVHQDDTETDEYPQGFDLSQAQPKPTAEDKPSLLARAASALAQIVKPAKAEEEDDEPLPTIALPTGLKASLEALQKAEAMPANTRQEQRLRNHTLKVLRPHCFNLQQGISEPVGLGANDLLDLTHPTIRRNNGHALRQERLAQLKARLNKQ